jgi:hypothetical protein
MTTYTRAFYAWLVQPTDTCPKWVNEAVSLLALLITLWQFVIYCCKTSREQLYEFSDALAGLAVRLTCTAEDIEYYNQLQREIANARQLYKSIVCWESIGGTVSSVDFINLQELVKNVELEAEEALPQPTRPNRATRRRRAKNG